MITSQEILELLPVYRDQWEVVKQRQYVKDIIREMLTAQRLFAPYYDCFSYLFYTPDTDKLARVLFNFCRDNIEYQEETEADQTSAIPAGILKRGYGDCKHYALFCAGVLGSLNRLYGCGLKWCFCFAAYNGSDEPYHVFVSLNDGQEDIWIDPTPGAGADPTLLIQKTV